MLSGASEEELELAKVVNGSWCISKEQLDYFVSLEKENKRLKNNWNELKEWLEEEYEHCDKVGNPGIGFAMGQIKRIKSKMQELEEKEVK